MNLREDKGYSYGARGGFSYSRDYGAFSAGSSVRTDSTFQSLIEINHEVNDLASGKRPVTAEELTREKQGAILGLPGAFATGASSLGRYRSLVYFGLPLDYYNSYVANVEKVTAAAVVCSTTWPSWFTSSTCTGCWLPAKRRTVTRSWAGFGNTAMSAAASLVLLASTAGRL